MAVVRIVPRHNVSAAIEREKALREELAEAKSELRGLRSRLTRCHGREQELIAFLDTNVCPRQGRRSRQRLEEAMEPVRRNMWW